MRRGRRLAEIEEEIAKDKAILAEHMREVAEQEAAEDAVNEVHDPSLDQWLEDSP